MRRIINYMLCSLLLATGWTNALAQGSPTTSPVERLKLTLVDNKSTFNIDEQKNYYENTLRLSQPDGNYKLTAGLLKEGDNLITFTRTDDQGGTLDFARINLSANARESEPYIAVSPTAITLTGPVPATGQFAFGGWSLNEDVTISIDNADFSVSPTVISPVNHDIEPQYITVTYNGNETEANATVTITSEAGTRTVEVTYREDAGDGIIGSIDFYNDYPHSSTEITVPSPWSVVTPDGEAGTIYMQTNGYAYVAGGSLLTFTVPAGYSNATVTLAIEIGPDAGYYLAIGNSLYQVEAGYTYYITLNGVSSGDEITFYGIRQQNGSYYYAYSPDFGSIIIYEGEVDPNSKAPRRGVPPLRVKAPAIAVAPTISYWDNETSTWGEATSLTDSKIYLPNETIDLSGLGNVVDAFSVSTALNDHPSSYTYHAFLDADILIPENGSSSFHASLDFNQCTSSDPSTAVITGENNWTFTYVGVYNGPNSSNTYCGYIQSGGNITYYVPNTFSGNTVAVTVTSGIGIDGAGSLMVNGIPHTFTSGSSYTWNVPVGANGAIIIQPLEGADWSVDLARIEIEGVITATTGAPSKVLKQPVGSMTHDSIQISSEYKQVK